MNKRQHTPETRAKMSATHKSRPRTSKWNNLPKPEIVNRLLNSDATVRSLAQEYGCSDSTIKLIFRDGSTQEERLLAKKQKQARSLKGYRHHASFGEKVSARVKGNKNPFFGKKHNQDFIEKQSKNKKGKTLSYDSKVKLSAAIQKVPLDQWNGFKTDSNKLARKNQKYANWRKSVFVRDGYTCQMCGKKGGTLHAHHIKKFSTYPDLRYEISNGITLCDKPCHKKTLNKEEFYELQFIQKLNPVGVGD